MQEIKKLKKSAGEASRFLKSIANQHRLLILCLLSQNEMNVTRLIDEVDISQTSMSQHLLKLREEGLIDFRREHRELYYYIADPNVLKIIRVLHDIYC